MFTKYKKYKQVLFFCSELLLRFVCVFYVYGVLSVCMHTKRGHWIPWHYHIDYRVICSYQLYRLYRQLDTATVVSCRVGPGK